MSVMGRSTVGAAALMVVAALGEAVAADLPVDIELVLAVDVSGSMDIEEQQVQRAGYIDAVTHPEVLMAIRSGIYGRIALAYVEWAGSSFQTTTIPCWCDSPSGHSSVWPIASPTCCKVSRGERPTAITTSTSARVRGAR